MTLNSTLGTTHLLVVKLPIRTYSMLTIDREITDLGRVNVKQQSVNSTVTPKYTLQTLKRTETLAKLQETHKVMYYYP